MFKDKKNIIILILSIIILTLIIILTITTIIPKLDKATAVDGSQLSSYELLQMFNKEGYEINLKRFHTDTTIYIILENNKDGITIQRILDTLVGTLMTYQDDSINDEMADLLDLEDNDTIEEKQQYKSFKNWLKKYNITKSQLSEMLDYYYTNNKNEIEYI